MKETFDIMEKLRSCVKFSKLSTSELAKKTDINISAIKRLKRGENISVTNCTKLCKHFSLILAAVIVKRTGEK